MYWATAWWWEEPQCSWWRLTRTPCFSGSTTDRKSRSCLCCFRAFSCLKPSLKLRHLSRLPNAHGLSQNNQRSSTSTSYQRAQQVRQSKGRPSTGRPPLRPKAPAQSPMLVTSSAPGASVQMVPNIFIPAAPGFQGVPMLQGMPGFQGLQMVQRLPMVQGMPMVQGIANASGNPDGSGDVNDTVTAYSCAGHQFTAFCTSCQSASHAQTTLQENCRGKHLQEVWTVLKRVQRDIANTGAGVLHTDWDCYKRTVVRGNAGNRFQIIIYFYYCSVTIVNICVEHYLTFYFNLFIVFENLVLPFKSIVVWNLYLFKSFLSLAYL